MDVREITRKQCTPFILGIHYAKRWPSISRAFGLFENEELVGVCTYGTPPSAPLRSGIAGEKFIKNILDVNRLCLVISFADTSVGHIGYVYQACNFEYFGLSAKRTDWKIKGMEHLHGQTIADKYRGVENRSEAIRNDYGDDFYLEQRPRKHRYIYVCGSRAFKKNARQSIRYKKENYPKAEQC